MKTYAVEGWGFYSGVCIIVSAGSEEVAISRAKKACPDMDFSPEDVYLLESVWIGRVGKVLHVYRWEE